MKIDPHDPVNHNIPLWCVYGSKCAPQFMCCRLKQDPFDGRVTIWGFSVYNGVPGFRTLGRDLQGWASEFRQKFGLDMFEFYSDQDEALDRMRLLTDPVYHNLVAQKEFTS